MSERHTRGGEKFELDLRATGVASGATRTAMLPLRPYRYGDPGRRDQVQVLLGGIPAELLLDEADLGPSYEWYRELAAEREETVAAAADPPAPVIVLPTIPPAIPVLALAPAAPQPPEPAPQAAGPERCPRCGYLTTAIGHQINCGAS